MLQSLPFLESAAFHTGSTTTIEGTGQTLAGAWSPATIRGTQGITHLLFAPCGKMKERGGEKKNQYKYAADLIQDLNLVHLCEATSPMDTAIVFQSQEHPQDK